MKIGKFNKNTNIDFLSFEIDLEENKEKR